MGCTKVWSPTISEPRGPSPSKATKWFSSHVASYRYKGGGEKQEKLKSFLRENQSGWWFWFLWSKGVDSGLVRYALSARCLNTWQWPVLFPSFALILLMGPMRWQPIPLPHSLWNFSLTDLTGTWFLCSEEVDLPEPQKETQQSFS